ncbi:MAG: hypothetical protein O3B87_01740 [bacterium]|nr:hypothetical protein [bacterium]
MQDILSLFINPDANSFFGVFFKLFAILFAVMYLVYSIVVTRQTNIMNKTFETNKAGVLQIVSNIQIFFALILLFISFTLI